MLYKANNGKSYPVGLQVAEAKVDGGCEQEHDFEIVRCTGHQHIGSRCITMYDADNGDKICQSCPVYGTELGETFCRGAAHAIGPVKGSAAQITRVCQMTGKAKVHDHAALIAQHHHALLCLSVRLQYACPAACMSALQALKQLIL